MVRRIAACAVEEPLVGEDADIIAGCVVGVFARHVQERSVHELKISDAFSDRTEACDRFFTCWTRARRTPTNLHEPVTLAMIQSFPSLNPHLIIMHTTLPPSPHLRSLV